MLLHLWLFNICLELEEVRLHVVLLEFVLQVDGLQSQRHLPILQHSVLHDLAVRNFFQLYQEPQDVLTSPLIQPLELRPFVNQHLNLHQDLNFQELLDLAELEIVTLLEDLD